MPGDAMMRWVTVLAGVLTVCLAVGCENGGDRGKNRDLDKPRSAEKGSAEKN